MKLDTKHNISLLEKYMVRDIDLKHNVDKIKVGGLIESELTDNELNELEILRGIKRSTQIQRELLLKYKKGDVIKVDKNIYIIIKEVYKTDDMINCMQIKIDEENNMIINYEYVTTLPNLNFMVLQIHIPISVLNLAIEKNQNINSKNSSYKGSNM